MDLIEPDSAEFVASGTLSQKIMQYNNSAAKLVPYLEKQPNFCKLNAERTVESILSDMYTALEPTVIHIRPGAASNELRKQITDELSKNHNFHNLDINALIRDENERKTEIGREINKMVAGNKIIPAEMIVRILRKIIYSGDMDKSKFILSSFPDIIEQAKEFEANCSKISAVMYCTTKGATVEIKNNNLSLFNIDSFFQKEYRLKTMHTWNYEVFQ
jgi:adenylate kinase family enzyme